VTVQNAVALPRPWLVTSEGILLSPRDQQLYSYVGQLRSIIPKALPPIDEDPLKVLFSRGEFLKLAEGVRDSMRLSFRLLMEDVAVNEDTKSFISLRYPTPLPHISYPEFKEAVFTLLVLQEMREELLFEEAVVDLSYLFAGVVVRSTSHPLAEVSEAYVVAAMMLGYREVWERHVRTTAIRGMARSDIEHIAQVLRASS